MGATSDDLMDLARAGAERIDMPDNRVRYPSFTRRRGTVRDRIRRAAQCAARRRAVRPGRRAAPGGDRRAPEGDRRRDADHELIEELVDNLARQIWLNQEAAFHLGMAVGLRLAEGRRH